MCIHVITRSSDRAGGLAVHRTRTARKAILLLNYHVTERSGPIMIWLNIVEASQVSLIVKGYSSLNFFLLFCSNFANCKEILFCAVDVFECSLPVFICWC